MVTIKTKEEIQILAEGGKILAKVLDEVSKMVKPGVSTSDLNRAAEALILSYGAIPSFKNYMGFPAAMCTSINEIIVHGIPNSTILKEGDIISLDLGVLYKGFNTDMAVTVPCGKIKPETEKLVEVTKEALKRGISQVRAGAKVGDIGAAVQEYIESQGFGVVRELCGHGIGKKVHEDPQIPNYGKRNTGFVLKEGMIICIEPMATEGEWQIKKAKDGYGFQTIDGSLSAHFELTMAVTKDGYEILTKI